MSLATKIIFIAALVLSIIIPFGYYLIGEKNKKRYKRTIGVNAFFFFGAFAIVSCRRNTMKSILIMLMRFSDGSLRCSLWEIYWNTVVL